jgi:hypothetical protein
MQPPVQLIRLTKTKGGNVWVNPEQIIFAEQYEKKPETPAAPVKDAKTAAAAKPVFETILHVTGKEPKLFVKEAPDELNKILRTMKRTAKVENTYSF